MLNSLSSGGFAPSSIAVAVFLLTGLAVPGPLAQETRGQGAFVKRIEYACSNTPERLAHIDYRVNRLPSEAISSARSICEMFGATAIISKIFLHTGY